MVVYAVVEIVYLQILEVIGLAHGLEQSVAQSAVGQHGSVRIYQQQQLHGVLSRLVVYYLQHTCILTGLVYGAVDIQLGLLAFDSG